MLKVGHFSRIAGVSVRLLHHYEALGLFQPAFIDPHTGYRYYKAVQMSDLNKILALKDLGLTLQEIKQYVDESISHEELNGMLKLKQSQVYQGIEDELLRLKRIEYRLKQLDKQEIPLLDNVIIKPIPAQPYLAVRRTIPIDDFGIFLEQLISAMKTRKLKFPGTLTVLEHSPSFPDENFDLEMGFLLPIDNQLIGNELALGDSLVLAQRELPAVRQMATYLHTGTWGSEMNIYMGLGQWIETHGFEIDGAIREVYFEVASRKEENNVVELQIPVQATERKFIL